jgi:hypothetical protein
MNTEQAALYVKKLLLKNGYPYRSDTLIIKRGKRSYIIKSKAGKEDNDSKLNLHLQLSSTTPTIQCMLSTAFVYPRDPYMAHPGAKLPATVAKYTDNSSKILSKMEAAVLSVTTTLSLLQKNSTVSVQWYA